MARSGDQPNAEPNLTPILDMVFQLITFFIMVTSFKNAAIDETLQLPYVGSARPVPPEGGGDRDVLVLNVGTDQARREYFLRVMKTRRDDVEAYIAAEAEASLLANRMTHDDLEKGNTLPTRVVIRADKSTPFKALYKVIAACQNHGYRKFALKTAAPSKE